MPLAGHKKVKEQIKNVDTICVSNFYNKVFVFQNVNICICAAYYMVDENHIIHKKEGENGWFTLFPIFLII
jgi:hypothetical protein